MSRCRITVLKRTLNQDFVDAYKSPEATTELCDVFQDGQEFMAEMPWFPPEGFCAWAWADIRPFLLSLSQGGEMPGAATPGVFVSCCTDGFRPVFFKLERIE